MRLLRVAIIGSGTLSQSVAARLLATPDTFQPPALVPDAAVADTAASDTALAGADAMFVELPADLADPDSLGSSRRTAVALAESARRRGVGHVICCTSASPLKVTGASARRLDAWAEAETVWRSCGLNVTYLILPTFFQELLQGLKPIRVDGHICVAIPCASQPFDMMDADDAAEVVASCLLLGNDCYGRCLPLSAGKVTVRQLADTLSSELGCPVLDQKVSCEQLRSRGDPASVDLANSFEFILRFDQQLKRSVAEKHLPRVTGFADWCAKHRDRLRQLLAEV